MLNNAIVNNVTRSLPTITRMNNLLDDKNDIKAQLCLTGDLCSGLPASHKVGLFLLDICDETHALHYYNVSHLIMMCMLIDMVIFINLSRQISFFLPVV